MHKGLDYARSHNPTRWAYERCVAALESGTRRLRLRLRHGSDGDVLELLDSGAHVVALDDLYGGTRRLFETREAAQRRPALHLHSDSRVDELAQALQPDTRMIWVESPIESAAQAGRSRSGRDDCARARNHHHRGRQHVRLAMGAAAAGARLRHRRALGHQVLQRPLGRDRRRVSSRDPRHWPSSWRFCRTRSARCPVPSMRFS